MTTTPAEAERVVVRVLAVVEDHPDMKALLRLLLRPERGFEVLAEASCASEALELLCTDCGPGVIVLDQSLEGPLTGLELAPLLKEQAPDARIVLFTAHDLASEAAACPAVDRFVRKDRIVDLPDVLRALLSEHAGAAGH
jgi:DNA-binding NarL/FixJ family response regulator